MNRGCGISVDGANQSCHSWAVVSDAAGEVEVAVPRDRDSSFEPVIVKKRQRRLGSVDEVVLSGKPR
ncbi:hypothetical protein KIPE111705_32425 [Kibdelosporangium persicum]